MPTPMSVSMFPISEKYVSITPLLVPDGNTLVGDIHNALLVFAANSITYYSAACSLQQKMSRILCDWDFNYAENKTVMTELWHFFHSIEKKHIDFCDKWVCPDQCDCQSVPIEKRLLFDNWWNSFKNLVKTIDDRVDNNILLCMKPRAVESNDDHIYFMLTDLYLNMSERANEKYDALFTEIFYRIVMEKNNPKTFAKIVDLLQMISVDDFKFVGTWDTCGEFCLVDFYKWWPKYEGFKMKLEKSYKKIESSLCNYKNNNYDILYCISAACLLCVIVVWLLLCIHNDDFVEKGKKTD